MKWLLTPICWIFHHRWKEIPIGISGTVETGDKWTKICTDVECRRCGTYIHNIDPVTL